MAIYRSVQLSFWTDNKVEDDFTPEDKYFFLYLLTNPQTNICGCYEVSYSQMTGQTGYNKETINRLLERFEKIHNVIRYNKHTKEVLIIHWYKYNWSKSKDTLQGIRKVAQHIKCEEFKKYILYVVDCIENETPIGGPYGPREASVSDTDTVSDTDYIFNDNNKGIYINPEKENKENNNIYNIQNVFPFMYEKEEREKKETSKQILERVLPEYNISDRLLESVIDWIDYKKETFRFYYKERGLRKILGEVVSSANDYGEEAVCAAISESMASGYQGIVWDKLKNKGRVYGNQNKTAEMLQKHYDMTAEWVREMEEKQNDIQ